MMDADYFYKEFKEALGFLGEGWNSKENVIVWAENSKFYMACNGKEISIDLNREIKGD